MSLPDRTSYPDAGDAEAEDDEDMEVDSDDLNDDGFSLVLPSGECTSKLKYIFVQNFHYARNAVLVLPI